MAEFLEFILLKQVMDAFNGVGHTLHDVVRTFARSHMPVADDLEKSSFVDTRDIILCYKSAEFVLPFGEHIPILNKFYGHAITI